MPTLWYKAPQTQRGLVPAQGHTAPLAGGRLSSCFRGPHVGYEAIVSVQGLKAQGPAGSLVVLRLDAGLVQGGEQYKMWNIPESPRMC